MYLALAAFSIATVYYSGPHKNVSELELIFGKRANDPLIPLIIKVNTKRSFSVTNTFYETICDNEVLHYKVVCFYADVH